ncbi:MAG TPA: RraA family protein [Vicinamibacteria bacterium]|nr:RraA family protein [Vicinamibacteria bacterium]
MDDELETLKTLSTTTVSDALDRLGIFGQCLGLKPLDLDFRLCGRAFTMRTLPVATDVGTVGDYIDDVPPGEIVAIDNGGRQDQTVWGDILTLVASKRGVGGTVIDGVCRDVKRSLEVRYPIFSRGWSMRTGKDRVQLDGLNVTIAIGGARVSPGDFLLGDADGVVAVPRTRARDVIAQAKAIEAAEDRIREAVQGGMRLDEARKKFKYFKLQSRES